MTSQVSLGSQLARLPVAGLFLRESLPDDPGRISPETTLRRPADRRASILAGRKSTHDDGVTVPATTESQYMTSYDLAHCRHAYFHHGHLNSRRNGHAGIGCSKLHGPWMGEQADDIVPETMMKGISRPLDLSISWAKRALNRGSRQSVNTRSQVWLRSAALMTPRLSRPLTSGVYPPRISGAQGVARRVRILRRAPPAISFPCCLTGHPNLFRHGTCVHSNSIRRISN